MLKTERQDHSEIYTELYSVIEDELTETEQLLQKELSSQYTFVNDLLSKTNRLAGKRLRPALLLLFGKACGTMDTNHVTLAAAIEMVHTATLVHDDILDSAVHRRHSQTINHQYGNQVAILTGDYLFSNAFLMTSRLPTTFAAQEIGRATNKICEGEIRQIGTQGQFEISESDYIDIIDAKTAELCSCAARLGAHYAGAVETVVESAADYGTQLGIAFQIVDDLLDILGDEENTGKSLGSDLQQQKPTLPIIHHLNSLSETAKTQRVEALLRNELPSGTIKKILLDSGSIDYAQQKAKDYVKQALSSLHSLHDSTAKSILSTLPGFVLNRSH
ncbi:MAG: polyprenyl synthetase family protein [Planctomycetota bacterium]|nr:polyprenyl synthetase family protein [Planctomycetota bacterium]